MKTQAPKTRGRSGTAYMAMPKQRSISDIRQINAHFVGRFVDTVNPFLFSSTEVIALNGISL